MFLHLWKGGGKALRHVYSVYNIVSHQLLVRILSHPRLDLGDNAYVKPSTTVWHQSLAQTTSSGQCRSVYLHDFISCHHHPSPSNQSLPWSYSNPSLFFSLSDNAQSLNAPSIIFFPYDIPFSLSPTIVITMNKK